MKEEVLRKMRLCLHPAVRMVVAGLSTDRMYRCRQIVAEECTECGALFSPELPRIPGVERESKTSGGIQ